MTSTLSDGSKIQMIKNGSWVISEITEPDDENEAKLFIEESRKKITGTTKEYILSEIAKGRTIADLVSEGFNKGSIQTYISKNKIK